LKPRFDRGSRRTELSCDAEAAVAIFGLMNVPSVNRRMQLERFLAVAGLVAIFGGATTRDSAAAAQDATSCAKIGTAAERLACYDRVLPPPETASTVTPPVAPPQPAPARPAPPLAEGAQPGATQSSTEAEQQQATSVVVVGMRKHPGRSASLITDNGDVWLQIGAESVYLPKVPFDAELRPASMGTYFLRPIDHGWRVHVRRND
jgi:hypothetical protein